MNKTPSHEDQLEGAEPPVAQQPSRVATSTVPTDVRAIEKGISARIKSGAIETDQQIYEELNKQGLRLLQNGEVDIFNELRRTHRTWYTPNFRGATGLLRSLRNANFRGVDFSDTNLIDIDLANADFTGACLEGTRFCDANLEGTDFTDASLYGANFCGASLKSAKLTAEQLSSTVFKGAINVDPELADDAIELISDSLNSLS